VCVGGERAACTVLVGPHASCLRCQGAIVWHWRQPELA
jgi:hypothetical protein